MNLYWMASDNAARVAELYRYLRSGDAVVFIFDGCGWLTEGRLLYPLPKPVSWYAVLTHCQCRSIVIPAEVTAIDMQQLAQLTVQYASCCYLT